MMTTKQTKTIKEDEPNRIDAYVGSNVKTIRLYRELTQRELAKKIGVTLQQIQKYEDGLVRISPSRMIKISEAFECAIGDLYGKYAGEENSLLQALSDTKVTKVLRSYGKMNNHQREVLVKVSTIFAGKT